MRLATLFAPIVFLAGGSAGLVGCVDEETPLPEPVALACLTNDPLLGAETVAEGSILLFRGGPCGDVVYFTEVQNIVTPGLEPIPVAGTVSHFSPAGDLVALANPQGQVYDVAQGVTHELFEGAGSLHFLRDRGASPGVFVVGCGEGEVRVLGADGEATSLAEDVLSCPTFAPHAPILIYQDTHGVLHRLDVSTGVDVSLEAILYSDGRVTFPGSGRSDELILSSDGEVLLHRQRRYGRPQEWATFTRTSTGEPLGAIPNTEGNFAPVALPGGHVMAVEAGSTLWVLDQRYEFHAYLDTSFVTPVPFVNRQIFVHDNESGELFMLEAGSGLRGETLALQDQYRGSHVSPSGRFVAFREAGVCDAGPCEHVVVYDALEDRKRHLAVGDLHVHEVTDTGHVVSMGAHRSPGTTETTPHTRVYGPDGTLVAELSDRIPERPAAASERAIFFDSWDSVVGMRRLERVDLQTGQVTLLTNQLTGVVVARDRLYYTRLLDPLTGNTELVVTPF